VRARLAGYAWAVLGLLLVWEAAALVAGVPALPPPAAALATLVRELIAGMWRDVAISGGRVLAAVLISLAAAVPLGLLVGRSPRLDRFAGPAIYLTYPIPKVPFLPLLLLALGIGNLSKIGLIVLVLFFQILVATRDAARSVPPGHVLSARSLGAGPAQVYRHVIVPATLPEIFTSTRISVGTAVAVLFLAENVAGQDGLGYRIMDAWGRFAYGEMFAAILAQAILGVVIYEVIEALEWRFAAWAKLEAPVSVRQAEAVL
jgi:ABC-type nitrate/sulfonate/bicarbonate transport system permease component